MRIVLETLTLICCCVVVAAAQTDQPDKAFRGAPLNPSVLLFHHPRHNNGPEQVRRAAERGFAKVNVVVTLWCDIDEESRVTRYGVLRDGEFAPLTAPLLAELREALRATFAAAADARLDLAVTGHLNAGGEIDAWRNYFLFDPRTKYAGFSYHEAMTESVVGAIEATATNSDSANNAPVDFAIVGEMGRTVFAYPQAYRMIIEQLRRRSPLLRLGVSLNFDQAGGEHTTDARQRRELERLFAASDFLGMSNYRPFDLPPKAEQFAKSVERFLEQIDLPGVSAHRSLPIHFSEVAIGGGMRNDVPARSPKEAARQPWIGCTTVNPWKDPQMRNFRVAFHRALLAYLNGRLEKPRVTEAFLWSETSWDPLDSVDSGFADQEIVRLVLRHNRGVRERKARGAENTDQ